MNTKVSYKEIIENKFINKKVIVIGDLMVDRYISGKVRKISPEAPVPVLDYVDKRYVAGGASNVVNNLIGLGLTVYVSGVVSNDQAGEWLVNELTEKGALVDGVVSDSSRPTTMKTRYTTKGYQLLRVDHEDTRDIHDDLKKQIYEFCELHIKDVDAVILSDYLKGVLKDKLFINKIINLCKGNNKFVAVDTKSTDIDSFKDADILTPNVDEVSGAVGIKIDSEDNLNRAAKTYLRESGARILVLTRGDKGISVFEKDKTRRDFPAKDVEVFDVSGAGDTVLSTVAAGIISGLSVYDSVSLANYAAGVVITKRGTAAINREELIRSLNEE